MPMAWHFLFGESDEHADRIQQIVKKEYNSWIDSIGTGGIINSKIILRKLEWREQEA